MLHEVDVIRQFTTHIVHEVPAVAKSIAIWTLGLLHLLCLAEYPAPTFNTTIWQRRLLQVGVSWRTYTYPFFQHASVVYIKMPFHAPRRTTYVQSGRFYIGSTGIGVCKREFNRAAKLKQVHQMQSAHVELAIRYWSQFRNYSSFIMIVINHHPTYRLAWIQEHALLSYFQAPLNFPYITRILQFKSTGMIIQSTRKKNHPFCFSWTTPFSTTPTTPPNPGIYPRHSCFSVSGMGHNF